MKQIPSAMALHELVPQGTGDAGNDGGSDGGDGGGGGDGDEGGDGAGGGDDSNGDAKSAVTKTKHHALMDASATAPACHNHTTQLAASHEIGDLQPPRVTITILLATGDK